MSPAEAKARKPQATSNVARCLVFCIFGGLAQSHLAAFAKKLGLTVKHGMNQDVLVSLSVKRA